MNDHPNPADESSQRPLTVVPVCSSASGEDVVMAELDEPSLDETSTVHPTAPVDVLRSTESSGGSTIARPTPSGQSWPFRLGKSFTNFLSNSFGIASLVFLLAVLANIPILQFLSFGYLLEVTGRIARGGKFRESLIGLKKASHIGGILLGTWLLIMPIRLLSFFWLEAWLIDPDSMQTFGLRVGQWVLITLTVAHIVGAWLCGGKLRYFFWPAVAPVSIGLWLVRRSSITQKLLSLFVGWASPKLVFDICNTPPITDWFLPVILWKRVTAKNLYARCRDGVWNFLSGLNLPYYLALGFKGFVGTFLWLILPTLLLMGGTILEGPPAVISGLLGVLLAIPVFALLPYLQAHFSVDGRLKRFLQPWQVFKNFSRAPLAHVTALFTTLLFAIPLFLLKIEEIPHELLWTLSLVFVMFTWPARMLTGWAYRRGAQKEVPGRWWIRYPILLVAAPISFSFILIFFVTRYISWNGAVSLLENHVFLLPAPFWI